MPYGISKELGGDSPANVKFMEKCVAGITGKNKRTGKPFTKGEKIAICKKALENKKRKSSDSSMDMLVLEGRMDFNVAKSTYISRLLSKKLAKTYAEAEAYFNRDLATIDYDVNRLGEVYRRRGG